MIPLKVYRNFLIDLVYYYKLFDKNYLFEIQVLLQILSDSHKVIKFDLYKYLSFYLDHAHILEAFILLV
jgi:hypothetical protein